MIKHIGTKQMYGSFIIEDPIVLMNSDNKSSINIEPTYQGLWYFFVDSVQRNIGKINKSLIGLSETIMNSIFGNELPNLNLFKSVDESLFIKFKDLDWLDSFTSIESYNEQIGIFSSINKQSIKDNRKVFSECSSSTLGKFNAGISSIGAVSITGKGNNNFPIHTITDYSDKCVHGIKIIFLK